jgi:hypothetical protein
MGVPTSAVFSDVYLKFLEHNKIYNLLNAHHITGYFIYDEDTYLNNVRFEKH